MKKVDFVELDEWLKTGETELSKLAKEESRKLDEGIIKSIDLVELRKQAEMNIEEKKIKQLTNKFIDIVKNSH